MEDQQILDVVYNRNNASISVQQLCKIKDGGPEWVYEFLCSHGVLHKERFCREGQPMHKVAKKDVACGMVWVCKCSSRQYLGIKSDTIIEKSKLPLWQVMFMWYFFVQDLPAFLAKRLFAGDLPYKTILAYYAEFRNLCSYYLLKEPLKFQASSDGVKISLVAIEADEAGELTEMRRLYGSEECDDSDESECDGLAESVPEQTIGPSSVGDLNKELGSRSSSEDSDDNLMHFKKKCDRRKKKSSRRKRVQPPIYTPEGCIMGPPSAGSVEIDESWFGKKAKYHRGTSKRRYIVFGIVAKKGTDCIFHLVKSVKRSELLPLIKRHIDTSCVVVHDGHRSYSKLHEEGYQHCVVEHKHTFVTRDKIHTNTIEGLWGLMKQKIAYSHGLRVNDCGGDGARLGTFLDEYSYRKIYGDVDGPIRTSFARHGTILLQDADYWKQKKEQSKLESALKRKKK